MTSAFDIAEPQVLAHVAGQTHPYMHLVLMRRIDNAKWLALKPSGLIETVDLATMQILPLVRSAAFPDALLGQVTEFSVPLVEADMAMHQQRASAMLRLLSSAPAAAPASGVAGTSWRICHTGCPYFGDAVPDEDVNTGPDAPVRGAMGVARFEGQWWPIERVPDNELASWMEYMRNGTGRDERLAGMVRDGAGRRFVPLHEYLGLLRPQDRAKDKDYPHRGPSAAIEVLQGVRASGRELIAYDEHWAANSGISPQSSIRHEHRTIFHTLAMLQSWNQVDIPNLAGCEYLCRRAVQIQRAVRVNPRAPSFIGLHKMTEHSLDEAGGLATADFTQHFASVAEADARILKQNRLLRSELHHQPSGLPGASGPAAQVDDSDDGLPKVSRAQRKAAAAKAKAKAKAAGAG